VETVRPLARQAAQDGRFPGPIEIGDEPPRRRRVFVQPLQGGVERRRAGKGELAGHHLVHHQPQRVEVGLRRRRLAPHLLGRHVGRRADQLAGGGQRGGPLLLEEAAGEAEVGHHGPRPLRAVDQEDVAALQVAVDDAALVRGGEAAGHLEDDRQRLRGRQAAVAGEPLRQRLAVQPLHGEEGARGLPRLRGRLDEIEGAADVRVGDPAGERDLALEALHGACVAGGLRAQDLERHRLVELEVESLVHLSHGPGSEEPGDPVAPGEEPAGLQARRARAAGDLDVRGHRDLRTFMRDSRKHFIAKGGAFSGSLPGSEVGLSSGRCGSG
jgi:hypothetical protein